MKKRTRNLGAGWGWGRPAGEAQSKGEAGMNSWEWMLRTLPSLGLEDSWESIFHPKLRGEPGPSKKGGRLSRVQCRTRPSTAVAQLQMLRGKGRE